MSVHFLRVIGLCEKTVYPRIVAVYSENLPSARQDYYYYHCCEQGFEIGPMGGEKAVSGLL